MGGVHADLSPMERWIRVEHGDVVLSRRKVFRFPSGCYSDSGEIYAGKYLCMFKSPSEVNRMGFWKMYFIGIFYSKSFVVMFQLGLKQRYVCIVLVVVVRLPVHHPFAYTRLNWNAWECMDKPQSVWWDLDSTELLLSEYMLSLQSYVCT